MSHGADQPDLRTLPKAELHIHIEGTLEPELAFDLAARNNVTLPYEDVEDLRRRYDFDDLQSFLDLYYECMGVLKTKADFRDLTIDYLTRADRDGVRHVELFFDPQVHARNGIPVDTVIDGLLDGLATGRDRFGITGGLIMCFVRDLPVDSAERLLAAVAHRAEDLVGVGLDSAEVGYPPSLFAEIFDTAANLGLRRVAHAGEEGPPAYVREALDTLQVDRVDHGIRAVEDSDLVRELADRRIPLTVCPLSNITLKAVRSLAEHPIRDLLAAGVMVTINSDDPAYFGGYIAKNYEALAEVGMTVPELTQVARNSIAASFADPERKAQLQDEITRWSRKDETPAM